MSAARDREICGLQRGGLVDVEGCTCADRLACDSSCTANFQSVGHIKKSSLPWDIGLKLVAYIHWVGVTSQGWSEGRLTLKDFGKNRAQMEANIEPLFFTLVGPLA